MKSPIALFLMRYLGRLRFPTLFKLAAALFVINLFIPDPIPFLDEILLGLGAMLIGAWKKHSEEKSTATRPVIEHDTQERR